MTMLPIKTAALQLAIPPGTLRRYCREGCPHRPGGKGRGKAQLVDPAAVRSWLGGSADTRHLLTLADDLPQLLATAIFESWRNENGPHKRALAGVLPAIWYSTCTQLLDKLREQNADVPDVQNPLPPEIEHLRKIALND